MAASNDGSTMFGINTVQGQVSSEYLQPTAAPEVDSAPSLPTISQGPVKDEGPDSSSSLTIPRAPMEQASLDKRMDFVLECSRRAGFANFDSAVSSYYIAEFSDSSVAANAQRLSRKRHLPRVLVDLRETAEAQGYSDEILKSAENLLVAECSNRSEIASISKLFSIDSLNPKTSHQSSFELSNELQDPQKIAQLKKSFQYALPNLWSLVSALTTDITTVRPQHHSHLTLATMSLLYLPGKVSRNVLQSLVTVSLQSGEKED